MLKILIIIICLIPFFMGFITVLGLVKSFFSKDKSDSTIKIEIQIEDKKNSD